MYYRCSDSAVAGCNDPGNDGVFLPPSLVEINSVSTLVNTFAAPSVGRGLVGMGTHSDGTDVEVDG